MFVVTVVFEIWPQHVEEFRAAMLQQAQASLETESGCHQFDVACDPADPSLYYLYELYTDEAAFAVHLESAHFKRFDQQVASWVASKVVRQYERIWPPS